MKRLEVLKFKQCPSCHLDWKIDVYLWKILDWNKKKITIEVNYLLYNFEKNTFHDKFHEELRCLGCGSIFKQLHFTPSSITIFLENIVQSRIKGRKVMIRTLVQPKINVALDL